MDRILLVGSGDLASEVATALDPLDVEVTVLDEPDAEAVEAALDEARTSQALVISRDDASPCGGRCSSATTTPTSRSWSPSSTRPPPSRSTA